MFFGVIGYMARHSRDYKKVENANMGSAHFNWKGRKFRCTGVSKNDTTYQQTVFNWYGRHERRIGWLVKNGERSDNFKTEKF